MATNSALNNVTLDSSIFNESLFAQVCAFWFSDVPETAPIPSDAAIEKWYGRDPAAKAAFDAMCAEHFQYVLDALSPAQFPLPPLTAPFPSPDETSSYGAIAAPFTKLFSSTDDTLNANTALALLLLLDQIPRSVYRDDPTLVYHHYDRIARAVQAAACSDSRAFDRDPHSPFWRNPARRLWFYTPLLHSERPADHARFDQLVRPMMNAADAAGDHELVAFLADQLEHAKMHADVITEFGRFPYRNSHLGRETTAEEHKWISEKGHVFGAA